MTSSRMPEPGHVLVVDDDPGMRRVVGDYLVEHGLTVTLAANRTEMVATLSQREPNVLVLDLKLGETDGLDILRDLRSRSDLPVMIVTGHRVEELDRVVGLELGADDYITKPFSLRELLARIRVMLRRAESMRAAVQAHIASGSPSVDARRVARFGGWVLDRRLRRLQDPDGTPTSLTNGEYTLLVAFLNSPLRLLSREDLLQATRVHEDVFDRSIDVQILRLRRRLDTDPSKPSMIRTERGKGYVFSVPVEQE